MNLRRVMMNWFVGPRRQPERTARRVASQEFRLLYPNEGIAWTALRAVEETRYIIGVYYGTTRPPYRKYFEILKGSTVALELENDAIYRPRNDR